MDMISQYSSFFIVINKQFRRLNLKNTNYCVIINGALIKPTKYQQYITKVINNINTEYDSYYDLINKQELL